MKQWSRVAFIKVLKKNGYHSRNNGSHSIYINSQGKHITIPLRIEVVIARRLIKENNLKDG